MVSFRVRRQGRQIEGFLRVRAADDILQRWCGAHHHGCTPSLIRHGFSLYLEPVHLPRRWACRLKKTRSTPYSLKHVWRSRGRDGGEECTKGWGFHVYCCDGTSCSRTRVTATDRSQESRQCGLMYVDMSATASSTFYRLQQRQQCGVINLYWAIWLFSVLTFSHTHSSTAAVLPVQL